MLIVPVIDLKDGLVVRGVAGRREEYRPIVSQIAREATPSAVAEAFAERFGFREAYVADLDAIAGQPPNQAAYEQIASHGLELWIDAGIATAEQATRVGRLSKTVIAGLESLASRDALRDIVAECGADRVIFSLDLKAGQPITTIDAWRAFPPERIAAEAMECGVRRMIVLDLADVGVGRGTGTLDLVRRLRAAHAQLEMTAGGGVRSMNDLHQLAESGCHAALVASALHDGRISPDEVRSLHSTP